MPFPTIAAGSNANIRPAAIQYVYIRPSGELYQTLGAIQNGELMFSTDETEDSLKKNKAYAWKFTAKATMLQASLTAHELIDTITNGTSSFLFRLMDSGAIPTVAAVTEGWVLLTSSQVGVKAKLVVGNSMDDNVKIELEWSGSLLVSEVDAAIKASIDDGEFEATGGTGTLKALGTYTATLNGGLPTPSQIVPCGVTSITLAETGGAAQTITKLKDFSMTAEWLADTDSLRKFNTYGIAFDISFSWMETNDTNLLNLDAMPDTEVDVVVNMKNGMVYTLTNQVGIGISYESAGDNDKMKVVKFKHTGRILQTAFDAIVA